MNEKPFNALGVGVGEQMTESLIPALQANADLGVRIPALVDPRTEVAEMWAKHFGIPRVYTDLDSALRNEQVDLVVLAVPHAVHHQLAAKALTAGKHVVLEKPFTESAEQAADLIRIAGSDLVLTPNYQYPVQAENALSRLARGECGTVGRGTASWLVHDQMPDRPAFWDTRFGGVAPDRLSHLLPLILLAIGTQPVAVIAHGSNVRGQARYGEAFVGFDTVAGTVLFEDGRHAWVEASWCADIAKFGVLVHGDTAAMSIPLMAAELDAERFAAEVYRGVSGTDGFSVGTQVLDDPLPTPTEECFAVKMRNTVRACRGEEALSVGADLGLKVRQVLDAIQASAEAGGELTQIQRV